MKIEFDWKFSLIEIPKKGSKIFAYSYASDKVIMGKFDDIDYYGENRLNIQGAEVILDKPVMRLDNSNTYYLTTYSIGFFWDYVKPEFNSPPRLDQLEKYLRKKKLEKLNDSNN
jgi:hypothetical protein